MSVPGVEPALSSWKVGVVTASPSNIYLSKILPINFLKLNNSLNVLKACKKIFKSINYK